MKGVIQFGKKGKLSLRYIGPFTITERIGNVAYKLDLPSSMSQVHNVIHMDIKPYLTYEEKSVEILQREIEQLRSKKTPLVKVKQMLEIGLISNGNIEKVGVSIDKYSSLPFS
ncbi:uncharacterized protein LOC111376998 [Olea europaea var. sylvestris]|uniref:uncharacterized protein LOC111376998 n=1 Tax=Olea europaea var. sylvestris TaxID=158386 RepID=UPI000C1D0DF9|nr:uncharacterized protein LOC111376998 [Olea europaea var. sylvestris]